MATQAGVRQAIRDNIYSSRPPLRPFVHQINGAINSSITTITVDDGDNFAAGDIIEFEDGEQCYVVSVSTDTLTVIRGYNGTTAASQSDNDVIYKNPRITIQQIDTAVDQIIKELFLQGIYVFGTGSITLVADQFYYTLSPTDIIEPLSFYYADTNSVPVPLPFKSMDLVHTALDTNGHGVHLWEWGDKSSGDTVYYTYQQLINDVTDLLDRQEPLVVMGATARILGMTILPETHDPGKRSDRTVQPGQGARDARYFQAEFFVATRAEQAQLKVDKTKVVRSNLTSRVSRWVS